MMVSQGGIPGSMIEFPITCFDDTDWTAIHGVRGRLLLT